MSGLMELSNAARKVSVGGKEINVYGISAEGMVSIFIRFPELGKLFDGLPQQDPAIVQRLLKLAPSAVSAVIAAGCGEPENPEAEKIASRLGVQDQLSLLSEILRLTFPRGVGPFVEELEGLGVLLKVENAPSPRSVEPSKSSSKTDT